MPELPYWQALQQALRGEMQRDPSVFLMGEDIGVYGGAFGVTRGLLEEFGPERVRCTPISEGSIVGAAVGAALTGLRPVVEIMFMDFLTLAMDQLANHAAKFRYMYGAQSRVPLVIRTPAGGGRCYGATHSQTLTSWFLHVPGLKVVAPATPADAHSLLQAAIRDDNPVLFIEHKLLYAATGLVPENGAAVPIGSAAVVRDGADATLVTYSYQVQLALRAAEELAGHGIDVEVIDLRTLNPLDINAVVASVKKTGKAVVIYEGWRTGGAGAEIAAQIYEAAFDHLDAPVERIATLDTPIPYNARLERAALPSPADIVKAVERLM